MAPRRRQLIKYGAVGALSAPLQWAAPPASAAPSAVQAAGDLALWYDEAAGTDWLRALPVGNGRLGAMVFGNTASERLQLNEDTVWAGGPHDYSNTAGAERPPADPAADLRRPVGPGPEPHQPDHARQARRPARLPARRGPQPRLHRHRRDVRVRAVARPDHRCHGRQLPRERRALPARGHRHGPRPGHRRAPHRRHRRPDLVHRLVQHRAARHQVQPRHPDHRPRRQVRRPPGHRRRGQVPRPRAGTSSRAGAPAHPAARSRCPARTP